MKLTQGLAAVGLMTLAAVAARAEVTGTVTAVSDYDFRGISLSAKDPALQGSVDYANESGFYAGAWASNLDYGDDVDGDLEVDVYLGLAGGDEEGIGWDIGAVYYTYPGADDIEDYPEFYAGLTFGNFGVKQWYTHDYGGTELDAFYTEANADFALMENLSLGLHVGYNYGDVFEDTEYFDYSVGLTYTLGNFDLGLKYVDTDLGEGDFLHSEEHVFNSEGRVIFSISTTFPWGD